jgi:hypothetical protein
MGSHWPNLLEVRADDIIHPYRAGGRNGSLWFWRGREGAQHQKKRGHCTELTLLSDLDWDAVSAAKKLQVYLWR